MRIACGQFKNAVLFLLLSVTLTGCSVLGSVSDSMFMPSAQDEIELGAKLRGQLEPKLTIVTDPEINQYVTNLGNKLWSQTPRGEVPPRFHVVKDKELNAFAIPGGDVYVNTGTIKAADDEAELAGVMAHELGHVTRRHGAHQISREKGINLIQQIVASQVGVSGSLAASLLSSGVMFNYSRDDEREADVIAVGTLNRLNYDPLAMRDFFVKIKEKYGDKSIPVLNLFASHPPTAERMESIQTLVDQLPPKKRERPTSELNRVKERLG